MKKYLPDVLKGAALGLLLTAIKLQYPARFGFTVLFLIQRARIQDVGDAYVVSLDIMPASLFSIRIPKRERNVVYTQYPQKAS